MKAFTFQSVQFADRRGVQIEVKESQVLNLCGDGERQIQLTDDEALDLLAWLRRWEGADARVFRFHGV